MVLLGAKWDWAELTPSPIPSQSSGKEGWSSVTSLGWAMLLDSCRMAMGRCLMP